MNFDAAFVELIGVEGKYSNRNPVDDPGGETMYGVTVRVARRWGYMGPMRDLPLLTAKAIYFANDWNASGCELVPEGLRFDLFDTSVNSGPHQAILFLQRAAGAHDDGILGPQSFAAIAAANPDKLRRSFNGLRLEFLCGLNNWPANSKGWARRVAANLLRD